MIHTLYYCNGTFRKYRPEYDREKIITEKKSRLLYDTGKRLTVLIDSDLQPSNFITIDKMGCLMIYNLDNLLRNVFIYSFHKSVKKQKYFLSSVTYYGYTDDTQEAYQSTKIIDFNISENGFIIVRDSPRPRDPTKKEPTHKLLGLEKNPLLDQGYVDFPEFGCYDELINQIEVAKQYLDLDTSNALIFISKAYFQLSQGSEATTKKYIRKFMEIVQDAEENPQNCYPDIPLTKGANGETLMIVPPQENPVPPSILRFAKKHNLLIRDLTGRIYQ